MKIIGAIGGGAAAAGYGIGKYAEDAYPPHVGNREYKPGNTIMVNGKNMVVIGYTGHHKDTFANINTDRELYYGPKKVAQQYAKRNGGSEGHVGVVVGDAFPDISDHGIPRIRTSFGATSRFYPLAPEGLKKLNVKIVCLEQVSEGSELGKIAALKRMSQSIFDDFNNKKW